MPRKTIRVFPPPVGQEISFNEAAAHAAENRSRASGGNTRRDTGFNEAAAHAAENRPRRRRANRASRGFNEAAAHAAENHAPRFVLRVALRPLQ